MAASSGALADFARLPPERKALVFIVIGAVLGLLYFQFVFKSLNSQLDDERTKHDTQIATSAQLTNDIPKYDVERAHKKQLQETIDENQKALPTEAELPAFYETLNRKILESGVELNSWEEQHEEPLESFVKVPVTIEITGTYLQLKRFFASLVQKNVNAAHEMDPSNDERERIVSIERLQLTSPTVKNGTIVLTAKFTAATFRQEDQAPKPPGAPGAPAAAAAPGAPPPPPSPTGNAGAPPPPPPPMPSAATPAGAKARVEDSLEKGAARNANAGGVNEAKTPSGGGSDRLKGGM
jgi:Tfp pilus assembly protein PilO